MAGQPGRKTIIAVAVVLSIVLYMSGVLSGLYAKKIIERNTQKDLGELKQETQKNLDYIRQDTLEQTKTLEEHIFFLNENLKSLQAEQLFLDTLSYEKRCEFFRITMDDLFAELRKFWSVLPYRIEEFERESELSPEYLALKKEYTQLSLRTWVVARKSHIECSRRIVHGLHFYSRNCTGCVSQGEEIDVFSEKMQTVGVDVALFTIDAESDSPFLRHLLSFYGIESLPAVIVNDRIYQGGVVAWEELVEGLNESLRKT